VSTTITRQVVFESVDHVHPVTRNPLTVQVRMTSTLTAGHAVTLTFKQRTRTTVWTFARDLLIDGVVAPAGLGDVRVAPHQIGWVAITLRSPNGTAAFRVRRRTLTNFLADTVGHVDITTELDEWLRGLAA
jgi:hypothetical protein